jgi:hypothetical protein
MAIRVQLPRGRTKTSAVSARCKRPQQRATVVVYLAILCLGISTNLSNDIGSWVDVMALVVWALAGLVFALCKARVWRAGRRYALDRQRHARRRPRGVLRRLIAAMPAVRDEIIDHPGTLMFALLGPVVALTFFRVLPALVGIVLSTMLASAAVLLFSWREHFNDAKEYVWLPGLGRTWLLWLATATFVCFWFGWPKPSTDVFKSLAQLNATLLVTAVLTIAAPMAWRTTRQKHFAWIATGPLLATMGLGASIIGSISNRFGQMLFPIALAAVPAILLALFIAAYQKWTTNTNL